VWFVPVRDARKPLEPAPGPPALTDRRTVVGTGSIPSVGNRVDVVLGALEGFRTQNEHIVHVSGSDGQRITLSVIPPEAPSTAGHDAMMRAAQRSEASLPEDILTATGALPAASVPRPRPAGNEAIARSACGRPRALMWSEVSL
jgi:hypothetical protein